ncbi:MAG: GLPGLI family protein [Flavobacterium sp.]
MKTKSTLFIFLLLSTISFGQSYSIEYEMVQVSKQINLKTVINTYLNGNDSFSIYEEDFTGSKASGNEENENLSLNQNTIFFKDLKNNTVFYKDQIRFKFFTIEDKNVKKEWVLKNDYKTILGYSCQKATTTFRGREFNVYFAKDIPIADGPWKLNGLPVLILEVASDDSIASFFIQVKQIKFSKEKKEYVNKYEKLNNITYVEFKSLYIEKYEESLYKIVNAEGETRPMNKGFIEYYIE